MKIAVVGHKGFVGKELIKNGCVPLECDVTQRSSVDSEIKQVSPDVIIYAEEYSDIDKCEKFPKKSYNLNVQGVVNVTDHLPDGIFIYLSSVHVFSGHKMFNYSEKHKPDPINIYGFTKWGGELATEVSAFLCKRAIVVRTSKLFNRESLEEDIELIKTEHEIERSDLIKRSFLYLPHYAEGLMKVIQNVDNVPDLIHIAGTQTLSCARFWNLIADWFDGYEHLVKSIKLDPENRNTCYHGGLSTRLAKKSGIPLYSANDGIKEMLK